MKRKLLFAVMTLFLSTSTMWADTDLLTEDAGWTKVTSEEQLKELVSTSYFAIVDKDNDVMWGLGDAVLNVAGRKAVFYQTSADPTTDAKKLWILGSYNGGFSILNYEYQNLYIQTEWDKDNQNFETNDVTSPNEWSLWFFAFGEDESWTIKNNKGTDNYVGVATDGTTPADGVELFANKKGENIGHFLIYAISRSAMYTKDDFDAAKAKYSTLLEQTDVYTDKDGAKSAFEAALTAADTKATNGSSKEIAEAIEEMKQAAYTFMKATVNEGAAFNVTFFITNPDFAGNKIDGWEKVNVSSGGNQGTDWQCQEFWNNTYDFTQTLTGVPSGSYSLSVQAFTRPGSNAVAYADYKNNINNVHSELYVNNDASRVGNIYDYKKNTSGAKVTDDDYECNPDDGETYWVPNGMAGARKYFDEGAYKTTVAALVEDGNLKIGFRDNELTPEQWTIFSNFQLYYYGESKLVYYQQYLPQLKAEVRQDLSNDAYKNVQGKELSDLNKALSATPSTENDYAEAIDAIKAAQETFRAARTAYDALAEAKEAEMIEKRTANIGGGAFQISGTTNDDLYTAYETAKTSVVDYEVVATTTAEDVQKLVEALNEAIDAYNSIKLNAPVEGKLYNIINVSEGYDYNGYAVTFKSSKTADVKGNTTAIGYVEQPASIYPQGVKFTASNDGLANGYLLSYTRADGNEIYLGTGISTGHSDQEVQIRPTDDASKAVTFQVIATATEGVWNLYNTRAKQNIGAYGANDVGFYTAGQFNDMKIQEAVEAEVVLDIEADNVYATLIVPFDAAVPSNVKAYTVTAVTDATLTLSSVEELKANTPYVMEAENGATATLKGIGAAYTETEYTEGLLTGVYEETKATADTYVLQNQEGDVAFYLVAAGKEPTIKANRAYLTVPNPANLRFGFPSDEATGIEGVNALLTGEYEAIYNAAGVQVNTLQKGLNILKKADGKTVKVIVQ